MNLFSNNQDYESRRRKQLNLQPFYDFDDELENNPESIAPITVTVQSSSERYDKREQFALGGEKTINVVFDKLSDRELALAIPHKTDTNSKEEFLREAWLTAGLQHPNIISIHDIGIDKQTDTPFFTMDLLRGDTLGKVISKLKEGDADYQLRYPQEVLFETFLKVCDAVSYAHSLNVIHLDLKPDNIHLGKFGNVFVCDWGLAKIITDQGIDTQNTTKRSNLDADLLNNMTLSGHIKGTPGYMAPEQIIESGFFLTLRYPQH